MERLYRLAGRDDFGKRFSHRGICTMNAVILLQFAGRLELRQASGDAVFAHFGCAPARVDASTKLSVMPRPVPAPLRKS